MFWSYGSEFLLNQGFRFISITMNIGQFAEMLILITVPFSIRKLGLRNTLIIGIIALCIRYLSFYSGVLTGSTLAYFIGIMIHGVIFSYFYVGGQIYIDKIAPPELKAQAQGFVFLVNFGLGLLAGNFISRRIIEYYSHVADGARIYNWNAIWGIALIASFVILIAFIIFFKDEQKKPN